MEFTHFDDNGNAFMVDVSEKEPTHREAVACGSILVSREVYDAIIGHKVKKGDVLTVAQVAGIMGAKKTAELIPMCHILNLTNAKITFELDDFNQAEEPADEAHSSAARQLPQKHDIDQANGTASDTVTIKAYCRVKVDGKTRFVCVDGPEFDAHKVDFNEMLMRMGGYKEQEKEAFEAYKNAL